MTVPASHNPQAFGQFDPRVVFPHFYGNEIIAQVLGPRAIWTVSDPTSKMPIDIRHLLDGCHGCTHSGPVRGAWARDERVLVTLDELTAGLPTASNCAMFIDAPSQGCVVLDIEKTCPTDVCDELLAIGALYAETSLSGKGYHLLLPLPASFNELTVAASKAVLKGPHGWWEILQSNHFVTYTRNPVPTPVSTTVDQDLWDRVWRSVAEDANATPIVTYDSVDIDERPQHEWYDSVLKTLIARSRFFGRTLDNFEHDHSRYEWAYAQHIYNNLIQLRVSPHEISIPSGDSIPMNTIVVDETAASWLIYETLDHYLEHRPKHDETRGGMPLLLNLATRVVVTRETDAIV